MQDDYVRVIRDELPAENFPEIEDFHEETKRMLSTIHDQRAMERFFRKWGGRDYRCWNCYSHKPQNTPQVKADLDGITALYPNDHSILGAWHFDDGRPIGMQWEGDQLTGTPWYYQPAQTINFMPDIPDPNSPDPLDPIMIRPTELSDVLLMFGQGERVFTEDANINVLEQDDDEDQD